MGLWSIVVPEGTQNLVTNPSLEVNATGYTAVGGTAVRDAMQQRRGIYALKITPTAGVNDGAYYAITLQTNKQYTFSVDVLGVNGVPYKIYIYDVTGAVALATTTFTGTGKWQRITVTATTGANTSHQLYVVKNNSADTGVFYADGWQCEQKAYATTFVDGDQDGYTWDGAAHASTSTRSAQSRLGGRDVDIDSYGVTVSAFSGMGMPAISQLTQNRALLPGSLYRGYKINERSITLTILANSDSAAGLHLLRKKLIDVIKPDRVTPPQPFLLRYTGAGAMVEILVVYDTGLEQVVPFGFNETIVMRLLAHDQPIWREDGERGIAITATNQGLAVSNIIAKLNGQWNALGNPGTGSVFAIALSPDGNFVYIGGSFLDWAGNINADYIAAYNVALGTWQALGTGMNGSVTGLAVAPNGDLYAGGFFTTAGGITANRIAKWNGSAWSALGTGADSDVHNVAVAPNGDVYIGGAFLSPATRIAKWNGSAWSGLGTGANATVRALAITLAGTVYAGGEFTSIDGVAATRIAKWNGSVWTALGSGLNNVVFKLFIAPDGTLYAGGSFSTAGGIAATGIAKWNGNIWAALGSGVSGGPATVYEIAVSESGLFYVGGQFTSAGGNPIADNIATWNGSTWSALDVDLPGSPVVQGLNIKGSSIYIGFTTSGTALVSAYYNIQSSVNNPSTAVAYPIMRIKRTGGTGATLTHLKNETTGKIIYFNHPLADGESITIDLRLGKKSVMSSFVGNMLSKVLPNSNLASWALAPGDNSIAIYMFLAGAPTIDTWMWWKVQHWAVDGVAV